MKLLFDCVHLFSQANVVHSVQCTDKSSLGTIFADSEIKCVEPNHHWNLNVEIVADIVSKPRDKITQKKIIEYSNRK